MAQPFLPDTPISEFVPISTHVSPTVLKTRDGDFVAIWRLDGFPFVGRDEWEIEYRHRAFNRLLQSLRAPDFVNVAFWMHDVRRRGRITGGGRYAQRFCQELADAYFGALSDREVMRNELYLTLIYRPVVAGKRWLEKSADKVRIGAAQRHAIAAIQELAANTEAALKEYAPARLGMYQRANGVVFSEALEFLGYLVNHVDEPMPALPTPVYRYLPVARQHFSARTGDFALAAPTGHTVYGAILNIKEYPEGTWPGVLNGLKYLDFEYVITHSFSPIGRQDALKSLERTKGMMISSGDRAVSQVAELDEAMDQVASGNFVLGQYHFTMTVFSDSRDALPRAIAAARAELSNAGFVSVKEDLAVAAAFHAQLPANWRYRTRLATVSSLNFVGLAPLHNFATGKKHGNPWGDCITTLQTTNGQPYYFNFHATRAGEDASGEKAIGNTLVIGKSGTGKTALINFLVSETRKLVPPPTVFFFDKDHGAEIFVRACGGNYLAIQNGRPTGFNPFQCDRSDANAQFLAELMKLLADRQACTAREEQDIFRAVENMLDTPMELRSITNFRKSLPDMGGDGIHARMRKWTRGNSLGWVFDNPVDAVDLERSGIIGFDYTDLIDNAEVRVPVVHYLLHRLEALIDGRRLIYVMDEFWKILDGGGGLKEFARNKQRTIRKQNGLGIFATQSPEDALASDISSSVIEQAGTLILLPNPGADRRDYVEGLKLTEAEYQVVANLDERSRCFLVKQGHASAVCQLNLRGMDDALAVVSASTDNLAIMHEVLRERAGQLGVGTDDLEPEQWLDAFHVRRKGVDVGPAAAPRPLRRATPEVD